jgi:hypothetical protein
MNGQWIFKARLFPGTRFLRDAGSHEWAVHFQSELFALAVLLWGVDKFVKII